ITYYVLVRALDAPLHSFAWAKATYWLFVVGVVLVAVGSIVTPLLGFKGFAASWVFLYPLPLPQANTVPVSDVLSATIFLFGVILIGISIILYTLEVLLTVQQNGPGILRGLGLDVFRTPKEDGQYKWGDKPFPTAVIPLTVNAIGMLIATPIFALLLIFMVLEVNGVPQFVDALVAKNMLWWFGHPVVYQLLFPMAGVYYLLVPQYAKRPMLGQRIIAFSWFIAFLVQNIVWAHHIYMDFIQPLEITVTMQLSTYAITIPSLASLFTLVATMIAGEWEWNTTTRFAFTGIVGWFMAGIQGVINATVWENTIIHNTLWVPGHFHTMALFNILMAIFAMTYYLLPKLTGKNISERSAKLHWWGTLIGLIGMVHFWLLQGILGFLRRSAVLPDEAALLTLLSVPFFLLMLVSQYFFFAVVWKNIWGSNLEANEIVTTGS
ncbi:MAG: cbb3-type cytochrome c oxidase subunit I, partial [Candidatus Kariarchaeaceae archaeon]